MKAEAGEVRFARKPMVSVIVPACGQVGLTARCVAALKQYTDVPWELVLVSNGSSAAEAAQLQGLCEGINGDFIHHETMLGYPKAVNVGVASATGEYICLLNNDAAFTGPWAKRLIWALNRGEIVSPVVDQIGQPCQRLGSAPGTLSEVGMLFFVCVVMRRSLFMRMGGLDERYGLGNSEDVQFCEDVKARGGRLLVEPGVFVTHKGSATFLSVLGPDGYGKLLQENNAQRVRGH